MDTYEKKYKEALERARKLKEDPTIVFDNYSSFEGDAVVDYIFPELKESEDEKLCQMAIMAVSASEAQSCIKSWGVNPDDVIAWLEKHDKPADKVEPRFKVGDFIVNDYCRGKVIEITNDAYLLDTEQYIPFSYEHHAHLWTIQDAKDGDVLSFYTEYKGNKMVQIGIIEKYVGKHGGCSNTFKIYVGVNWENNLQIGKYMGCSDIRPATKEQRDTLFARMKEAGYEYNNLQV